MPKVRVQRTASRQLLIAALLMFVPLSGRTQTVNVSLGDNQSESLDGPAGGTGRAWNTWAPTDGFLFDSEGNNTSVKVTAEGNGPYGDWWCDLRLLGAGLTSPPGENPKAVSITGLEPGDSYDFYLTSAWGDRGSNTQFTLVNPTSTVGQKEAINRADPNGSTWVKGQNYVLFQDIMADQEGTVDLSYVGGGGHGILNGLQIIRFSQVAESYGQWASHPDQGLTSAVNDGHIQDPDRDGIINLVEFVTNGNPMIDSTENGPQIYRDGSYWTFEYDRRDASRYPYTEQVVEYSFDLVEWFSIPVPTTSSGIVSITDHGHFDRIQVALPLREKIFVRLNVLDLSTNQGAQITLFNGIEKLIEEYASSRRSFFRREK